MKPACKLAIMLTLLVALPGCASFGVGAQNVSAAQYATVVQDLANQAAKDVPAGYVPLHYTATGVYGSTVENILRRKGYALLDKGQAEPVTVEVLRDVNTIFGALRIGHYRVSRAYDVTAAGVVPEPAITTTGIEQ